MITVDKFHPAPQLVTSSHEDVAPICPVIDTHAHFGPLLLGEDYEAKYDTKEVVRNLRDAGLRNIFSLELVWEDGYERMSHKLDESDGFILPVGSVDISRAHEPDFEKTAYRQLRHLKAHGCPAVKLWKNMTLYSKRYFGRFVGLDDAMYDCIWQACGELDLPIIMHVADPPCFFEPIDGNNEHYVCLAMHPEWSFYAPGIASFSEHMRMQTTVVEKNPNTTFVIAHVGSYAENLTQVGEWLDSYPNLYIDVAARIDQLGRQPYTARDFLTRYADRVLFGTDFEGFYSREKTLWFYKTHYRFFQTRYEYFEHPFPEMLGQWRIFGVDLPSEALKKIYAENAVRLFGIS